MFCRYYFRFPPIVSDMFQQTRPQHWPSYKTRVFPRPLGTVKLLERLLPNSGASTSRGTTSDSRRMYFESIFGIKSILVVVFTYANIYIYLCVCAYACMYVYIYVYILINVCANACVHIYTYIYIYKYIYIIIYIYIYIYGSACQPPSSPSWSRSCMFAVCWRLCVGYSWHVASINMIDVGYTLPPPPCGVGGV